MMTVDSCLHNLRHTTAKTPVKCHVCLKWLWSLRNRQYLKCRLCRIVCHERCAHQLMQPTHQDPSTSMPPSSNLENYTSSSTSTIDPSASSLSYSHQWKAHSVFEQPLPCALCQVPIWGLQCTGVVQCGSCSMAVHVKCLKQKEEERRNRHLLVSSPSSSTGVSGSMNGNSLQAEEDMEWSICPSMVAYSSSSAMESSEYNMSGGGGSSTAAMDVGSQEQTVNKREGEMEVDSLIALDQLDRESLSRSLVREKRRAPAAVGMQLVTGGGGNGGEWEGAEKREMMRLSAQEVGHEDGKQVESPCTMRRKIARPCYRQLSPSFQKEYDHMTMGRTGVRRPLPSPATTAPMPTAVAKEKPTTVHHSNTSSSTNSISAPTIYERRIHPFRGHEFVATYLAENAASECKRCCRKLADGGRQCYQCRLCSFVCHKKCYTSVYPCAVGATSLQQEACSKGASSTKCPWQSKMIYESLNRCPSGGGACVGVPHDFIEDFADELIVPSEEGATRVNGTADTACNDLYDYVLDDQILGSGQYGIVKRAHYRFCPETVVAVKIVDKKRLWTPQQRMEAARNPKASHLPNFLQRELNILKQVDHPGVVRLHHFVDTATHTYIIMDLAPDGDLLDCIMANTKLTESKTKPIIKQVVKALMYLHKFNVVHRDLKPENILLTKLPDGFMLAQIADFGFATRPLVQCMQSVVGTPAYMAPEIVDPRVYEYLGCKCKGYDKSADMWSLGVIAYITLGGVFPFDSQKSALDQILKGEFFFPDEHFGDVSDSALDFICNLIVVDPRRRLTAEQALAHPWLSAA